MECFEMRPGEWHANCIFNAAFFRRLHFPIMLNRSVGLPLAYIGLGSNQTSKTGDPASTIVAAINSLSEFGELVERSSLFLTEPVGFSGQPSFINAVVALRTTFVPERLMQRLLEIERRFGRDRSVAPPKGPRPLDLDLLLVGDEVISSCQLKLPHPALAERRFVLAPLAQIAPDVVHPVLHRSIRDLLKTLPSTGPNRISGIHELRGAML